MALDWTPSWGDFTSGLGYLGDNPEAGLLFVPVTYPLFALGAGINELTGGDSPTYNAWTAAQPGGSAGTTYSDVTQALSGYQGAGPGTGEWGVPILNPATPRVVGDALAAVTEGVLGVDPKTILILAAVIAAATLAPQGRKNGN